MTEIISFIAVSSFFNIPLIPTVITLLVVATIIPAIIHYLERLDQTAEENHNYEQQFAHGENKNPIAYKSPYLPTIRSLAATAIMMLIIVLLLITNYQIAREHGLSTYDITIKKMNQGIINSPIESKLPTDINKAVIIYYKFTCPDCWAVHSDLEKKLAENPNNKVYWISATSAQGKKLLADYPTEEVPSGIYISDTLGDNTGYIKNVLYTKDEAGNQHLHVEAIDRLLQLQNEQR